MVDILTAEDVPNNKVGHIQQDWDVMIPVGSVTRYVGDALCLVIAESPAILEAAKNLIKIEYEPLEPIRNVYEAIYLVRVTSTSGQTRVYQNMIVDATPAVDGAAYKPREPH